ncbi:MAG TPA: sigma-70 family RNA polymerase sigma factor [Vicinamibacteria bacterium]
MKMEMISLPNGDWAGVLNPADSGLPKPRRCGGSATSVRLDVRSYGAFWALWRNHDEFLHRLSLRLLKGRHADAEDALSAAKLKAMSYFCSDAVAPVNARALLARLLYTTCMDIHRQRCREEDKAGAAESLAESVDDLPALFPSPEQELLGREQRWHIARLVDELPRPWREALVERCVRRKSYSAIARESGTTGANIRKRVQLARAFLRERL